MIVDTFDSVDHCVKAVIDCIKPAADSIANVC